MKFQMNFTTSEDDVLRYASAADLQNFYKAYGLDGLEVMPMVFDNGKIQLNPEECPLIRPNMVTGVHVCCIGDWMGLEQSVLIEHYRKDLEYARNMGAEYVVFHVTQVSDEESFTYQMCHTDEEVIDASCLLINELLDGQDYSFWFLMENLWWPGLTFLSPACTRRLLQGVHYPKKGLMLDAGHFLHTNLELHSQEAALAYLETLLDTHRDFLPYIKGIHLHQSLTGSYVQEWLKDSHPFPSDPAERFCKVFEHIFSLDLHQPFTTAGVKEFVECIAPLYVTYEYITRSRQEHEEFLKQGTRIFRQ